MLIESVKKHKRFLVCMQRQSGSDLQCLSSNLQTQCSEGWGVFPLQRYWWRVSHPPGPIEDVSILEWNQAYFHSNFFLSSLVLPGLTKHKTIGHQNWNSFYNSADLRSSSFKLNAECHPNHPSCYTKRMFTLLRIDRLSSPISWYSRPILLTPKARR